MARFRIPAAFVLLAFIAGAFGPDVQVRGAASAGDVQGDVNCDGNVNAVDSLQILRSVAGLGTSAGCLAAAGDTNCDGGVNAIDSLRILRRVAGLNNTVPGGCTPIGDALGPPPSSFDLIDEALEAGDIDERTALVYKVYATFGDDALPDEYRGDDSSGAPDGGVAITQSMLDGVSAQTQALLAPFLVPPIYEDSWMGSQGASASRGQGLVLDPCPDAPAGWSCFDGVTASVRVWWQAQYPEDEARAQTIANAMDSAIWPTLTGLMGTPPSDAGQNFDGGSGAVDIYLVDVARSAAIDHAQPGCKKTPAYINLQRAASLSVVAHEFMHVLQWSFDVASGCMYQAAGEYNWLAEATATWAQDFVSPGGNEEHYIADWYMQAPGKPLDTADDSHEYGAYLFFLYVTRFYDTEQIVRTVWNNTTQHGSLQAVDQALPGGLAERWPAFAGCLWNRPPVDCFAQWDGLAQGVEAFVTAQQVELGNATGRSFEVDGGVKHMAASFTRFEFPDENVNSVVFQNTLAVQPNATVQALAKVGGEWQGPMDWTGRETAAFCRNIQDQHVEELIVLIANSDWQGKSALNPPEPPALKAGTGCAAVTLSWDADIADVDLQLWVLPGPAADLDEARGQEGLPGYGTNPPLACSQPFQAEQTSTIAGITADTEYFAVYWWGTCQRDRDNFPGHPPVVPFTITIQFPDGHEEVLNEEMVYLGEHGGPYFASFGPYDFTP